MQIEVLMISVSYFSMIPSEENYPVENLRLWITHILKKIVPGFDNPDFF